MDKFEVGEIAITNAAHRLGFVPLGAECEIISVEYRYGGGMGHDIIVPNHPHPTSVRGEWHINTVNLRKKKPPEEEIDWVEKLNLVMPNKEKVTL